MTATITPTEPSVTESAAAQTPATAPAAPSGPSIGTARMADGTMLRTLRWSPAGDAWAVAEIVHGLGEHGGRYETVGAAFTGAGIDTWSYDHRGNGGSGGPRVYVERWSILHDDLERRLAALRELHPGLPLVLYGHSLGGLVAAGYVLSEEQRLQPDLLVLSAPSLDDDLAAWKRPVAGLLTRVIPKMKLPNGVPGGAASRDPAVRAKSEADPLCSSSSTIRFGAEAFREQDRLGAILPTLGSMPVPTFVFHGSDDPIVPLRATEVLEGMGNVTRSVHEGLRHECHHEPEREAVLAEVVAWIRATAAPATGAGAAEGAPEDPVPDGV